MGTRTDTVKLQLYEPVADTHKLPERFNVTREDQEAQKWTEDIQRIGMDTESLHEIFSQAGTPRALFDNLQQIYTPPEVFANDEGRAMLRFGPGKEVPLEPFRQGLKFKREHWSMDAVDLYGRKYDVICPAFNEKGEIDYSRSKMILVDERQIRYTEQVIDKLAKKASSRE